MQLKLLGTMCDGFVISYVAWILPNLVELSLRFMHIKELPYEVYHVTENLKFVVDKDTTNWIGCLLT